MTYMKQHCAQPQPVEQLDAIERRIAELKIWLQENGSGCCQEQAHLDEGTTERAYWHYGYLIALRDVLQLIQGKRGSLH